MEINKEIILKVMSNYHAAQIVNEPGTILERSNLSSHYRAKKVTVEERAKVFGFTDDEISAILYCREVKFRFNFQFNKICENIPKLKKNDYSDQLDELSELQLSELTEFVSAPKLFGVLKSNFPTLPIYTVPGEITSKLNFTYVALFADWYDNDLDFPLIREMNKLGMAGATVIRLAMDVPDIRLLYALVKLQKIEAIICYYDAGGQCYDWDWIIKSLFKKEESEKAKKVFHKVLKNQTSQKRGEEGINYDFLQKIAKTYVRRTRVKETT